MTNLAKIALVAVSCAGLVFTSCNSDSSDDVETTQSITNCYARVTDLQDGSVTYATNITIGLDLNWTAATGTINISGLSTPATVPTLTFTDVKWGSVGTDGWMKAAFTQATVQSTAINTYTITDFQIEWLDRLDMGVALGANNYYQPACVYSFVLDGRYKIVGSRVPFLLFGSTSSTAPDGKTYETKKTYYGVTTFDFRGMTAYINIYSAQFVQAMPAMDMQFVSVPISVADDGTITLDAASLIPQTSDKTPQPSFPISDLHAVITPRTGMVLDFKCNVRNAALYSVHAQLDYLSYNGVRDGSSL